MATIVRVEHKVDSFDAWKKMFDSDPIGRKKLGVKRYQILRPTDNQNYVMIDLDFNDRGSAESFREALQKMWNSPDAQKVMINPQVRILDQVERNEL
jgi:hypothetical protein